VPWSGLGRAGGFYRSPGGVKRPGADVPLGIAAGAPGARLESGHANPRPRGRRQRGELQPFEYDSPPLGPHDALIRVRACGICHSDVHMIDDDWRISRYPLVRGTRWSASVEPATPWSTCRRAPGGRRWQRSSCLRCRDCCAATSPLPGEPLGDRRRPWRLRRPPGVDGASPFRCRPRSRPRWPARCCAVDHVYSRCARRHGLGAGDRGGRRRRPGHLAVQFAARSATGSPHSPPARTRPAPPRAGRGGGGDHPRRKVPKRLERRSTSWWPRRLLRSTGMPT